MRKENEDIEAMLLREKDRLPGMEIKDIRQIEPYKLYIHEARILFVSNIEKSLTSVQFVARKSDNKWHPFFTKNSFNNIKNIRQASDPDLSQILRDVLSLPPERELDKSVSGEVLKSFVNNVSKHAKMSEMIRINNIIKDIYHSMI